MKRINTPAELEALRTAILQSRDPSKPCITVCAGTGCSASGAEDVLAAFREELKKKGLSHKLELKRTCCHGFCERGPLVVLSPGRIFYQRVQPDDVPAILASMTNGHLVEHLLYIDPMTGEKIVHEDDIPFYKSQHRLIFANNGKLDPTNIEDYIALGGYIALSRVLSQMTPEQVIEEIKRSGLRGRGGAGFPTGMKWEYCRRAPGDLKYIICNGDEGDPGAFMDRSLLEGNPHSVLEGLIIGAYAIGAREGYLYIRHEYPLAVKHMGIAIQQAEEYGLLGENILGSGFDFRAKICRGGGAFVCGEETALIASIEGRLGEPRPRPPYPAQKGLWGQPTVINNVKTLASVPLIITKGADWYSQIGTKTSKGTMIFSLVGKINNTGLVEVPMGITLGKMIYDIGGGIPRGRRLKAVQTGGPSGGCIPASLMNLQVDYEQLTEAGSMMGSGGMVVMDENTCMVDVAKYFLTFTRDESCGKCTPCREGIPRMLEILTRITEGHGKMEDLHTLEELATAVKETSLCGLGNTAPNPVLTTLRYFRDEYEAHIKYKRCPAAVCKKLVSAPCHHVCPIDTDAPVYIGLIAQGRFKEALEVNWEVNPLTVVCGRVCHHPCEVRCRSGEAGDPISIKALKRFLTDYAAKRGLKPMLRQGRRLNEKVAIIGSGPAGLMAGWELAKRGYRPTIFEALPVAGGMLAVGIPEYRLPKRLLNEEIKAIERMGVEIKTNTRIGQDITLDDLFRKGYKAVFIATGAHQNLKLDIPGEEAEGVLDAVKFLREVNLGHEVRLGKKVAVIGGGDTAIDAARTAWRLGADVTILYRRTQAEMPARKDEVKQALEEGIRIHYLVAPVRVLTHQGRVTGLECVRMGLGEFDQSGRRRPVPIEGSEFTVEIDTLIAAIGQRPDLSFLDGRFEITKEGTLTVNPETLATNVPGIFAGGDVVSGPATVTEAMKAGKVAAESIHRYLKGERLERTYEVTRPTRYVPPVQLTEAELEELKRPEMPCLAVAERRGNFKEVELGLTEEMAIREARRCLRCDLEVQEERSSQ